MRHSESTSNNPTEANGTGATGTGATSWWQAPAEMVAYNLPAQTRQPQAQLAAARGLCAQIIRPSYFSVRNL